MYIQNLSQSLIHSRCLICITEGINIISKGEHFENCINQIEDVIIRLQTMSFSSFSSIT